MRHVSADQIGLEWRTLGCRSARGAQPHARVDRLADHALDRD